jgi:NAD-dependent DNA ligase
MGGLVSKEEAKNKVEDGFESTVKSNQGVGVKRKYRESENESSESEGQSEEELSENDTPAKPSASKKARSSTSNDVASGYTTTDSLDGQVIAFSGFRDAELSDAIEAIGGRVASSFSKGVTLVVSSDPDAGTGKVKQAQAKGIPVFSVEEFCRGYVLRRR